MVLLEIANFLGGVFEKAGWSSSSLLRYFSADLREFYKPIFVEVDLVEECFLGSLTLLLECGVEFSKGEFVVLVGVEGSETQLDSLPFKISECWAFN